jgi:hypothetical protein
MPPDRADPHMFPPFCEAPPPGGMIEADLAYLKTALKLTDAQLPAWEPVAAALRAQAKRRDSDIAAHCAALKADGTQQYNSPDGIIARLEDRQRKVAAEAQDLAQLVAALKPLYALLSSDQRESADELFMAGPPRQTGPMPPLWHMSPVEPLRQ